MLNDHLKKTNLKSSIVTNMLVLQLKAIMALVDDDAALAEGKYSYFEASIMKPFIFMIKCKFIKVLFSFVAHI